MREGNCSPSGSTALTVVEPRPDATRSHRTAAPQAAFLAHLIASAGHIPQFCDKRRVEPQEAEAAYRDAIKRFGA
jgi:hypothetical protein